ncbi:MAG: cytochrome C [Betaproteobacteria bacterium]
MGKDEKMNRGKCSSLTVMLSLVVGISAFLVYSKTALAQTKAVLSDTDCVKCHAGQVNDLAAAGGAHRGVSCSGGHAGHPPEVAKPIPRCDMCHLRSKKDHFNMEMPACLNCHTNPHRPLDISLKGADKDACLICHGPESWLLREYESKHTALNCSKCHDVHRKIPQCVQCHIPHSSEMVAGDCKRCHRAHMPKVEAFSAGMRSKDCGLCHKMQAALLGATTSKHKSLACIGCHKLKHRFKPACQDCHGTPHPNDILAKFQECGMCHNGAHNLNNWPETAIKGATGDAPKKQ